MSKTQDTLQALQRRLPSDDDIDRLYDPKERDILIELRDKVLGSVDAGVPGTLQVAREILRGLWPEPELRISKTHWIRTKTPGEVILFEPNYAQKKLWKLIHEIEANGEPVRIIILKARQLGFSTMLQSMFYDRFDTNSHHASLVISFDDDSAKELFQKCQFIHNNMWFPRTLTRDSNNIIRAGEPHGSDMFVRTAGNLSAGRSQTFHCCHMCLVGDTPVIGEHGKVVRADHLEEGSLVLTHNGNLASVTAVTASKPTQENGSGKTVKVTPWLGDVIELTPNHPVWTSRGWVAAGDLSLEDKVSLPVREVSYEMEEVSLPSIVDSRHQGGGTQARGQGQTIPLTFDFGFTCGYYLAEGSLDGWEGRPSRITLSRHRSEGDYARQAWKSVREIVGPVRVSDKPDSLATNERASSAALASWLEENFGRASGKLVPDWVFRAGEDYCEGLLTGYLSGDGSKTIPKQGDYYLHQMTATTICSSIATQIRDLAMSLGFGWGRIKRKEGGRLYGRNCKEAWVVYWGGSAARNLRDLVGLPVGPGGRPCSEKWERDKGKVWTKIRKIEEGSTSLVYDVEVSHEDHSFRTLYFSVKNSEIPMWQDSGETLLSAMQAVPTVSDSYVFMESTAKGAVGDFYEYWQSAEKGNTSFKPFFAPWFWDPTYRLPFATENLKGRFMQRLSNEDCLYMKRYELTVEQMNWRKFTISDKCQGSRKRFQQEYPACVSGKTRVSTEQGIIPISEASASEWTESGRILRYFRNGVQHLYRIKTKRGRVLEATADHPIQMEPGDFCEVRDLMDNAWMPIVLQPCRHAEAAHKHELNPFPGARSTITVDDDWARWLGYFMGDGSWYKGTMEFACDAKDEDVIEDVDRLCQKLLNTTTSRRAIRRVQGRKGAVNVRVHCIATRDLFASMGIIGQSDSRSRYRREVCIPEAIFRSPKPTVREFLRALFESDGSASGNCVRFGSCKEQLVRDVQLLLLSFGVNSTIRANHKKSGNGRPYWFWALVLNRNESNRFVEEIGFVGERKIAMSNPDPVKWRRSNPPNEMLDYVDTVESVGFAPVYDFTVEKSHVFSANGLLTHNCPEEAFLTTGSPVFNPEKVRDLQAHVCDPYWLGDPILINS